MLSILRREAIDAFFEDGDRQLELQQCLERSNRYTQYLKEKNLYVKHEEETNEEWKKIMEGAEALLARLQVSKT